MGATYPQHSNSVFPTSCCLQFFKGCPGLSRMSFLPLQPISVKEQKRFDLTLQSDSQYHTYTFLILKGNPTLGDL